MNEYIVKDKKYWVCEQCDGKVGITFRQLSERNAYCFRCDESTEQKAEEVVEVAQS